ncbi:MAG: queuosine salvage family protein [Bacilli bacterium]|nr:queuosine salvage family protein [Bacilli bacterium]
MKRIDQLKYVVENSDYVKINESKIDSFIKELPKLEHQHWLADKDLDLTEKEIILFSFLCVSINFCFWQKPQWLITYNNKKMHGSTALYYSLLNKIETDKDFLNINKLINLTKEEFKDIFKAEVEISLVDKRYELFMDTINVIYKKQDKFYEELYSIYNDEDMIKYIVTNFKYFNDVSIYKNIEVIFYKRATLLVDDLVSVSNTIKNNIKNINNLLACADYVIPKTLRAYGILEYNDELSKIIEEEKEIPHDSNMEIEIRANMIYAIELIKDKLALNNIIINSMELDNIIWLFGHKIKLNDHRHHTTTIFY